MSQLATQFHFDVTTDFGQAEQMLQDQIDKNRARVRVAADLSGEGVEDDPARDRRREDDGRRRPARNSRRSMGLVTPETTKTPQSTKELGPATKTLEPLPEI